MRTRLSLMLQLFAFVFLTTAAAVAAPAIDCVDCETRDESPGLTSTGEMARLRALTEAVKEEAPAAEAVVLHFTGKNVFTDNESLTGGSLGDCHADEYSGLFSNGEGSWNFSNRVAAKIKKGTGQVWLETSAKAQVKAGAKATLTGESPVEPGVRVSLRMEKGADLEHSELTGEVTLSRVFLIKKFPNGLPEFTNLTIDFKTQNGKITAGGMLLNQGHDKFSCMQSVFISF